MTNPGIIDALDAPPREGPVAVPRRRGRRAARWVDRAAVGVLAAYVLVGVVGPFLVEKPSGLHADYLVGPSAAHWFGTDDLGQDVFAQVVWGSRISITVGVAASVIAITIGVALGLVGAYFRRAESPVLGATDVMLSLPHLPLMIFVTALAGGSVATLTLVIGLLSWAEVTRLIRSRALEVAKMPYIDGARAIGTGGLRIILTEILPAIRPVIVVSVLLTAARAVIAEAGLSYLGLGDPTMWSWGRILLNAQRAGVVSTAWWLSVFPSLAILGLVLAATIVGSRASDGRAT